MPIILRPKHVVGLWVVEGDQIVPNAQRTPETYREQQRKHLAKNPAAADPYVVPHQIAAFIGGGFWRVHCRCREAPHADPEWGLSCCFGCGAIYEHVMFPPDWRAIEDLLVKRPVQWMRNWQMPETLEQLRVEQLAMGDPV